MGKLFFAVFLELTLRVDPLQLTLRVDLPDYYQNRSPSFFSVIVIIDLRIIMSEDN